MSLDYDVRRGHAYVKGVVPSVDHYQRTTERCCKSHHFEGCADGSPGCCPRCPINPTREPA